jgi:uncharacterized protein YbjT (DUF2867 family)
LDSSARDDRASDRVHREARETGCVSLVAASDAAPALPAPNPLARMHAQIEDTLAESGVQWTILRPGMFSANSRDWWAAAIRANTAIRWPYLAAPTAPIDERDIAEIAVRALSAPEAGNPHVGKNYVLTGPELLTQREQIEILGRALGRSLRVAELSPDQARRELLALFRCPRSTCC